MKARDSKPAENRISVKDKNEIVWTPANTHAAHRLRFVPAQDGKGPICYLTRQPRVDQEHHEFEFGEYLASFCSRDYWLQIWEGLFRSILDDNGETVDSKYLRAVAEAGITLAHDRSSWPLFDFTFEIVKRFCWQVPPKASKEYLHFCIKEWNQRSTAVQSALLASADHYTHRVVDQISFAPGPVLTRDFGEACEEELAFFEAISTQRNSEAATQDGLTQLSIPKPPPFWKGSLSDFVFIHDELRKAGYIIEGSDDLVAQYYAIVTSGKKGMKVRTTNSTKIKQRRSESKPRGRYIRSERAARTANTIIEELERKKPKK